MKSRKKKICDKCNREIDSSNFKKHYNLCNRKIKEKQITEKWKQENGMYKCPYCGKEYKKMGISSHIIFKHEEPKKSNFILYNQKIKSGEIKPWNKGLTKETSNVIKKITETKKKLYEEGIIVSSFKGKNHSEETKLQIKNKMKQAFKEGRIAGWKSRNIKSYPELYFETILKNKEIFDKCIREYYIKPYFLDFYFPEKQINLEIDGNQHKQRKESDIKRDEFLKLNNIEVFRIEWKNPKTKEGKKYLIENIKKFFNFYNNET